MNFDQKLRALADHFGILPDFYDLSGKQTLTSNETYLALLAANGVDCQTEGDLDDALAAVHADSEKRRFQPEYIVEPNTPIKIENPTGDAWMLSFEDEQRASVEGQGDIELPELPSGIHSARVGSENIRILAAPSKIGGIDRRVWGANLALFALRSDENLGIGDFCDLAATAEIFGKSGASFLGINPVHSIGWAEKGTISPYSPSHRGFLNTNHISLGNIPGLDNDNDARTIVQKITAETAGFRQSDVLDYPNQVMHLRAGLRQLFDLFRKNADKKFKTQFNKFCTERCEALLRFARFETLSEDLGPDWRKWPKHLQNSVNSADLNLDKDRVEFHQWLQWVADGQLLQAQERAVQSGMGIGLYLDLAVGPRRSGAEAWCEVEATAKRVSLGAPPDQLSPAGQNWGLAAFAPRLLQQADYAPLRFILRETMRHCGVLRIDHVLGLNRSYWIPDNGAAGGYIRQPFKSLLAVLAIEAEKANCVIVGEDLGLVPDGFRETMNERGIYSYSVLQYEKTGEADFRHPSVLNAKSLACFATHDTPTLQGYLSGTDIDWWEKLDWIDHDTANHSRHMRHVETEALLNVCDQSPDQGSNEGKIHGALAASDVEMITVQMDDILGQAEAQNLPGTIDEHPNWRRPYRIKVDQISEDEALGRTAALMAATGRNSA